MIARYVWTEMKEAAGILGVMFGMWIILGWTGQTSGVEKLVAAAGQNQDLVKISAVVLQALVSTIMFVPFAFEFGGNTQGGGARLPTLVALPVSRLSLGVHRYLGVVAILAAVLGIILVAAPVVSHALGCDVLGVSNSTVVARALLSVAIIALCLLSSNIIPGYAALLASLTLTLIFVFVGQVFRPGLLDDPIEVGAVAAGLTLIELVSFFYRKKFV